MAPMAPMAAVSDDDVTARKLFVRGLSWETETAQLLEAVCHDLAVFIVKYSPLILLSAKYCIPSCCLCDVALSDKIIWFG